MYVLPQGPYPHAPEPEQHRADTKHLLFYGKTVGFTEKQGHIDIHLISEKAPFKTQWPDVRHDIKAKSQHHELWPEDDPETMRCSVPYAWYWDRCTGILGLSHAVQGHKTWDLSDHYDPKYYVVQKNEPVSQINVQISALWDQSILDYVDMKGAVTYTEMSNYYKSITGSNSFSHILDNLRTPYKNRKTQRYIAKEGKRYSEAKYVIKVANPSNWVVVENDFIKWIKSNTK
jgi:hypothetical protein